MGLPLVFVVVAPRISEINLLKSLKLLVAEMEKSCREFERAHALCLIECTDCLSIYCHFKLSSLHFSPSYTPY